MIAATCPICGQKATLPAKWFTSPMYDARAGGVVTVPCDRAYHYHKTPDGEPCPSNGVKRDE